MLGTQLVAEASFTKLSADVTHVVYRQFPICGQHLLDERGGAPCQLSHTAVMLLMGLQDDGDCCLPNKGVHCRDLLQV